MTFFAIAHTGPGIPFAPCSSYSNCSHKSESTGLHHHECPISYDARIGLFESSNLLKYYWVEATAVHMQLRSNQLDSSLILHSDAGFNYAVLTRQIGNPGYKTGNLHS